MKKLKYYLRSIFNRFGIDVYPSDYRNSVQSFLADLITRHQIVEVWDVGANSGQYAQMLRMIGFRGKICSFEALPSVYNILKKKAEKDSNWEIRGPFAVGSKAGPISFYETSDSVSSSLLKPKYASIEKEIKIEVKPLSKFIEDKSMIESKLLKIDVQGAELDVIKSCGEHIYHFNFIQLEASVNPLYYNEKNYLDILSFLKTHGFKPIFFFPGIGNENHEIMQLEIFFAQNEK